MTILIGYAVVTIAMATAVGFLAHARRRPPVPYVLVSAAWGGWHTLRHTFASIQLARGVNVVALSRVLGHHSAAFTLSTYVHLLEGDEAPALDGTELQGAATRGSAQGSVGPDARLIASAVSTTTVMS